METKKEFKLTEDQLKDLEPLFKKIEFAKRNADMYLGEWQEYTVKLWDKIHEILPDLPGGKEYTLSRKTGIIT